MHMLKHSYPVHVMAPILLASRARPRCGKSKGALDVVDPRMRAAQRPRSRAGHVMNEVEVDIAIAELEAEMHDLQHRYRDLFAYANAWAERHDAILAATPDAMRASVMHRLQRVGIRWGVAHGVRVTAQFPALKLSASA